MLGKKLKSGGEGSVYLVEGRPELVAKVYHDEKFRDMASAVAIPRAYLLNKIKAMLDAPIDGYMPTSSGERILAVAWPEDVLLDSGGKFVGYVMPKVESSHTIHVAYRPIERPMLFNDYTWRNGISLAFNLASAVNYLHERGIVVGDFNSNNILINGNGFVTLIDADSFSIDDGGTPATVYRCMVGVGEYLAPELQGKDLSKEGDFTKESDCFSLAIHIFQLLTDNFHPFNCVGVGNSRSSSSVNPTVTHIAKGMCPFVSSASVSPPPAAPDMAMFPKEIRNLFDRAFGYDVYSAVKRETIAARPSAREWRDALLRLYGHASDFERCSKGHQYLKRYGSCPWCAATRRVPQPTPHARHSAALASNINVGKTVPGKRGSSHPLLKALLVLVCKRQK